MHMRIGLKDDSRPGLCKMYKVSISYLHSLFWLVYDISSLNILRKNIKMKWRKKVKKYIYSTMTLSDVFAYLL